METGDPKQLAAMGVAAVGALGFLGFRTLVHPPLPKISVVAQAESRKEEKTARLLPPSNDPFSHPRLAPAKIVKERAAAPEPVTGKFAPMPEALPGVGPVPGTDMGPLPPVDVRSVDRPKEKASRFKAPEGTNVGLEAIAGATDAVAFLTVEGGESQPYRPNDRIKGAIRLLRIEDGAVVLQGPKGELTLGVGERIRI